MQIKSILISQPQPTQRSPYDDIVKKYNVKVDFHKFFDIEPVEAREFRRLRIDLSSFTAVIFTSKIAVDHYFRLATEMRYYPPTTLKYFCINESISNYLNKYITYRKRKIFFTDGLMDSLIEVVSKFTDEVFLLPVANTHKNNLINKLKRKKLNVIKAVSYKVVNVDLSKLKLSYDIVALFSPSGVDSLVANFPDFRDKKIKLATFGSETTKSAVKAGLKVDIKAPTAGVPSMAMALEKYLKKNANKTK